MLAKEGTVKKSQVSDRKSLRLQPEVIRALSVHQLGEVAGGHLQPQLFSQMGMSFCMFCRL